MGSMWTSGLSEMRPVARGRLIAQAVGRQRVGGLVHRQRKHQDDERNEDFGRIDLGQTAIQNATAYGKSPAASKAQSRELRRLRGATSHARSEVLQNGVGGLAADGGGQLLARGAADAGDAAEAA